MTDVTPSEGIDDIDVEEALHNEENAIMNYPPTAITPAPTDPYEVLERARITPQSVGRYLYSFDQNGKEVVGLTAEAINHLSLCAGISIESLVTLSEDEDTLTMQAVAVNPAGNRHIGLIREPKKYRNGKTNPNCIPAACSKAQRNAKRGLLPVAIITDMIKQASGAAAPDTSALEQRLDKARELYASQKAEIEQLKSENEELKTKAEQMENTAESLAEELNRLRDGGGEGMPISDPDEEGMPLLEQ